MRRPSGARGLVVAVSVNLPRQRDRLQPLRRTAAGKASPSSSMRWVVIRDAGMLSRRANPLGTGRANRDPSPLVATGCGHFQRDVRNETSRKAPGLGPSRLRSEPGRRARRGAGLHSRFPHRGRDRPRRRHGARRVGFRPRRPPGPPRADERRDPRRAQRGRLFRPRRPARRGGGRRRRLRRGRNSRHPRPPDNGSGLRQLPEGRRPAGFRSVSSFGVGASLGPVAADFDGDGRLTRGVPEV